MGNKNQPNGVMEIDLLQLFRALWRNALVIILVAILFGGIAFGGTYMFISPKYEASAMMYVNNSSVTLGNTSVSITSGELSAAQTLVNTYIVILKSRATLDEVIQEAGVPYSVEKLSNMVSASAVSGTGIFRIKVESSSPTEAELIANTIARVLPDRISDIVDGSSVRVVDYAIVPAHRSSPSYTKNTAIGVLAGVVLVAGIICLKEILTSGEDVIIHSTDDLKELFPEIPVLAVVPDMRQTGKKGYYSAYSSYYGSDKKEAK
jgi:capsular polysaccharide biosynthesis protein